MYLSEKLNREVRGRNIYTNIDMTLDDKYFSLITVDSSNETILYLPKGATRDINNQYRIAKIGTGNVVLQAHLTDSIADSSPGGSITCSVTIESFATIYIRLVTENRWLILGAHGAQTTN